MTVYDPEALARQTAQQIALLNEHLTVAPSEQAARILGQVLDPHEGVLGSLTALVATGSRFAQDRASAGLLPPEVWLALGRAANELNDIALDLDDHAEDIHRLTQQQQTTTVPPAPSALVARRHR
ncbi:hypothetical protein [Streptomyces sp. H34-S4]|uniref:hypothetical protein n=1 Tax=Streptomyces sp. H34-S4 TaxID=2996463 RepID=UPI00226E6FE3|nr:hypothetical protein [Streptomyces sp. H34-S4]MCY0933835.1 hypothetical protein [Streptomyces sp. H34-S4]